MIRQSLIADYDLGEAMVIAKLPARKVLADGPVRLITDSYTVPIGRQTCTFWYVNNPLSGTRGVTPTNQIMWILYLGTLRGTLRCTLRNVVYGSG
jgi:hypothetical protein